MKELFLVGLAFGFVVTARGADELLDLEVDLVGLVGLVGLLEELLGREPVTTLPTRETTPPPW